MDRKKWKVTFFMQKRLVKKLEPLVKNYLQAKKVTAATLIQRMFRRYRERKQQLDKLKKRN
jgi:hypothetical protein